MKVISSHIEKIKKLCDQYHVKSLFAFGSITTKNFKASSDVDLVVDIDNRDPISYSDDYFNLKFQLEKILKRPIDLLEAKAIKNTFLKHNIEKTKVLVYGKGN